MRRARLQKNALVSAPIDASATSDSAICIRGTVPERAADRMPRGRPKVWDGRERTAAVGEAEDGNGDEVIDGCLVESRSGEVPAHRVRRHLDIRCFFCPIASPAIRFACPHDYQSALSLSLSAPSLALLSSLSARLLSLFSHSS